MVPVGRFGNSAALGLALVVAGLTGCEVEHAAALLDAATVGAEDEGDDAGASQGETITYGFAGLGPRPWARRAISEALTARLSKEGYDAVEVHPLDAGIVVFGTRMPLYAAPSTMSTRLTMGELQTHFADWGKSGRYAIAINNEVPWHEMKTSLGTAVAESLELPERAYEQILAAYPLANATRSAYAGGPATGPRANPWADTENKAIFQDIELDPLSDFEAEGMPDVNPLFPAP